MPRSGRQHVLQRPSRRRPTGRALLLGGLLLGAPLAARPAAAQSWGDFTVPSPAPAQAIGSHTRGCLAGAVALPLEGPGYQVMRPSRQRFYGHPQLVAFVEALSAQLHQSGHPGLLIGDLAQVRGGPMTYGHRSHQSGLDVDIWFLERPAGGVSDAEREPPPPPASFLNRYSNRAPCHQGSTRHSRSASRDQGSSRSGSR